MKKNIRSLAANERGLVMLIVLMAMMAVSLLGLASLLVVGTDIRISGHYRNSAQAFWAAEAGVQRALGEIRNDRTYLGTLDQASLGNGATSGATVEQLTSLLRRITATGNQGVARRQIEVIVNVDSAFESTINCGGDVILDGKPRISTEGVRVNGDAYLSLDAGTPELNIYMPTGSTLTVDGDASALTRLEKEPMDLNSIRLTDQQWQYLAGTANGDWRFDTDHIFGDTDTNVTFNNLNFNNVPVGPEGQRAIFVDGNVTVNGEISGIGTIVATGKIICTGGFVANGPTVSLVARDDVLIDFDTNAQSEINGLVYTEGDYELHGKVKFWGVVTAFGSVTVQNPSQFSNNSDPNYWYTYSPAYNIIADAVDIMTWSELAP